jgi:hypothetical protein
MENRIEINGEWYVKEDSLTSEAHTETTIDVVYSLNAETSDGKFRAFILVDGEGEIIQDAISIDYNGNFLSDSPRWIRDIIDMKENFYGEIDDEINKKDQNNFLLFVKALQKKGWF